MTSSLLAARPVLDRRSSHTGVVSMYTTGNVRRVSHTVGLSSPRAGQGGHHLDVPHARSRGSSLPGNIELVNQVKLFCVCSLLWEKHETFCNNCSCEWSQSSTGKSPQKLSLLNRFSMTKTSIREN
jgi:hypothetical protein